MSVYFEKAKELGELILASEASKDMADAQAVFRADADAVAALDKYKALSEHVHQQMSSGELSQDEFRAATEEINQMGAELKKQPVIGALVDAENEYNAFVNTIMGVLKSTLTGKEGCGSHKDGCGGGCSGCK